MKKICIVIVNYNGAEYQNEALESLYAMSGQDFDIVIVDNHSSDNSIELAASKYPRLIILKQQENKGFAGGCNKGIDYSVSMGYQYTLLINNDVIADKLLLSELLKYADESTITVPKIYFFDRPDVLWYAGGEIRWNRLETHNIGYGEKDQGQYDTRREVDFLNGCCMLVHNAVFSEIGKFDENFFMYFEDTDFGLRALEAQKKIVYVPSAKLWHKVSSSTGGEDSKSQVYYMNRNRLYFAGKYKTRYKGLARIYANLKACIKFMISPVYKRNNFYIRKAYRDFYRGQMGKGEL